MERNTRIRDIADALGLSIGTVDRALHDRRGVNPMTKARVLQMAKTRGYRPNPAARLLSSKRRLRISVNLPYQIASFWDLVREGIQEEANLFASSGVDIETRTFPHLAAGEEAAFEAALASNVNGIIMATGRPRNLRSLVRKASRSRIPVVCVATDAPGTERIGTVSIDSLISGSMAGELLTRILQGGSKLAVITGDLAITDHAEKYQSFQSAVHSLFPSVQVLEPIQNHEDETEAYEKCRKLLSHHPDLNGLYISTANSTPVFRALEDAGCMGRLTVITTDLFPALARHLESGAVVATLYQRPRSQGRFALRMLLDFIVDGRYPSHQLRLAPHLIMKSNLSFYLQRILHEFEAEGLDGFNEAGAGTSGEHAKSSERSAAPPF
jgi:LacI family transcriptional regulator